MNMIITRKLFALGVINSYLLTKDRNFIIAFPCYFKGVPYINRLKAVSRGNKEFNITAKGIKLLSKSSGIALVLIMSTKGLLTIEEIKKLKIGGRIMLIGI